MLKTEDCHSERSEESIQINLIQFKMFLSTRQYYVYILTNYKKAVLYTGVTNNLEQRIIEHYLDRGM